LDKKKNKKSDYNKQIVKSLPKNSNSDLKNLKKNSVYDYDALGKLKRYKRPIISDYDERKQLHNQISKELEKID
jgi:hypothetical protein